MLAPGRSDSIEDEQPDSVKNKENAVEELADDATSTEDWPPDRSV